MNLSRSLPLSLFLGVAVSTSPCTLRAQTNLGSVVGLVTDTSGAVVPEARVVVTNLGTTREQMATSSAAGLYTVPNLLPGLYSVSISREGFKAFSLKQIDVRIGGTARVDAALSIGDAQEVVEVTAESPDLQTDTSSLSKVIEGKAVLETPINGRNVNNLLALVPGVIVGGSTSGNPIGNTSNGAVTNAISYGNYQLGGGFGGQSAFFVDGVQSNVAENNTNALIPTQDAVQEFRVYTNDVGAEFGGFGGGVVNLGTKSGGSRFHGSAYDYFRNSALNANDWFSNYNRTVKPPLRQNQFGANLSGPLFRERTFFFAGWETERVRSGYPSINTVPTAAQVGGNFAGSANIYDLATPGRPQFQCNGVANVICANRLDPAAVKIIQTLYPAPLQAGSTNNYVTLAKTGGSQNQYNLRLDESVGKHALFVRYTYWNPQSSPSDPFGTGQGVGTSGSTTHQAVIGDTYAVDSKTVLDARLSYLRFYMYQVPFSRGYDIGQLGAAYQQLTSSLGPTELPALSIGGIASGANNSQLYWTNNAYTISSSVTRLQGRHTLKLGGSVRRLEWNTLANNQGITFSSTAAFTSSATGTGGNALASFLLGIPSTSSTVQVGGAHQFLHNYGFFLTDTYTVTQRLTLNLGLRWDQPGAYTEANDWTTIFDPAASAGLGSYTNPVTGTSQAVVGNFDYVNTQAYPSRRIEPLHYLLFSPRVGFAYRAAPTTVFHAGYGLSYLPSTLSQDGPTSESINSSSTSLSNIAGSSTLTTVSNPFPSGIVQPVRRNASALPQLLGQAVYSSFGYQPYSYVQQWNGAVEQAFPGRMTLTLAYAGAKGTHLLLAGNGTQSRQNVNQLPDQYLSLGNQLTTKVANPLYGKIAAGPLAADTVAQGLLLLPFPQYQQVYQQTPHLGASTYHSLQIGLQQRFSHGGSLGVAYTWSKILSNTDSVTSFLDGVSKAGQVQDNYNLPGERSISLQNIPQNFVANYGIELPLGHGQRYLSHLSTALNTVVGGWRANGITTFRSGQPLAMLNPATTLSSTFGANQIRPNYVSGCNRQVGGSNQSRVFNWFNKSCFTPAAALVFGSESRVDPVLRSAGAANWDVSLTKTQSFEHGVTVQFSTELFNAFNRAQFAPPDTNLANASSTYGQVTSQLNSPRNIQFALRTSF